MTIADTLFDAASNIRDYMSAFPEDDTEWTQRMQKLLTAMDEMRIEMDKEIAEFLAGRLPAIKVKRQISVSRRKKLPQSWDCTPDEAIDRIRKMKRGESILVMASSRVLMRGSALSMHGSAPPSADHGRLKAGRVF